jgi:protein SCO1/2
MKFATVLFAVLVLGACQSGPPRDAAAFRGVLLSPPVPKPDFELTDVNGAPYHFRQKTEGKVALLFFGYTHCPDVCPLHAANIAAVLKQMPFEERERVQFVFVTTDPERDTPARLKAWLGAFDASYVGLAGPPDEVARIGALVGVAPSRREVPPGTDSSAYLVGHGAQVIAFGLDNLARVEYPFGVRQEDWARDLPRLARGEVPNTPSAEAEEVPAEMLRGGSAGITVGPAFMPAPAAQSEAAVYVRIDNRDSRADTLLGAWSPAATGGMLHESVRDGGAVTMRMRSRVVVPAGGSVELAPGGLHLMLTELSRLPAPGEAFPLTLRFARAGDFVIAATVVRYADLEARLRESGGFVR